MYHPHEREGGGGQDCHLGRWRAARAARIAGRTRALLEGLSSAWQKMDVTRPADRGISGVMGSLARRNRCCVWRNAQGSDS